jgi:(S)-ureidoglycine aminohydrolase
MELYGTTRSCFRRSHALIAPDSFVSSELPGWRQSRGIILIGPTMGAKFTQYLAQMEPDGVAAPPPPQVERVIYVLEGELAFTSAGESKRALGPGSFVYCPPDCEVAIRALEPTRLNVFEKSYRRLAGTEAPPLIVGDSRDVPGEPFLGDLDARLQVLLPTDGRFDLAVNLFTFQPGAALPLVEMHIMEHGLLMLDGQGIYRLGDDWYPVKQGDVIWMAPFCPQWFGALGKKPASYLYYKDVNRDPMEPLA